MSRGGTCTSASVPKSRGTSGLPQSGQTVQVSIQAQASDIMKVQEFVVGIVADERIVGDDDVTTISCPRSDARDPFVARKQVSFHPYFRSVPEYDQVPSAVAGDEIVRQDHMRLVSRKEHCARICEVFSDYTSSDVWTASW